MKIEFEKSRVMFSPENAEETAKMEVLWRKMVGCVADSKKLAPIGEFVPAKGQKIAAFQIEGLETQDQGFAEIRVDNESDVYCKNCNKVIHLQNGEVIPMCCGKIMEILD